MRFSSKKTYEVKAMGIVNLIASTVDSFSSKDAVMYWANKAAEREHRILELVQVYCPEDKSYIEYTASGRIR